MTQAPSTDLQSTVQDVAGQAQESIQQVAGQATDVVKQQLDERSTTAGESAGAIGEAARHSAAELRSQGQDLAAQVIEQAATRVEQLGQYLRNADGESIIRDVERFGREQPWAIIAGGTFLGFAASRFLKASSSRRHSASQQSPASTEFGSAGTGRNPGLVYTPMSPPAPPLPEVGGMTGGGSY